jgi:5-methylcytosine-specific restriction protein A
VLDTVITDGYAAYGIRCRAVDYQANPRKRKSFEIESLLDMRIRHIDNDYIGQIVGHIPAQVISERGNQASWIASTAINDIGQDEVGNVDPEYKRRMTGSYVRVPKVRDMVLKRAGGVCEYCGKRGFLKADGKIYLETHHVILLSEQGSDTLSNVIALCPNHHREAHFGDNWRSLQDEFLQIIKKLAQ